MGFVQAERGLLGLADWLGDADEASLIREILEGEYGDMVLQSLELAYLLHMGEFRKEEHRGEPLPYLFHVLQVAAKVVYELCVDDPVILSECLLHDADENAGKRLRPADDPEELFPLMPLLDEYEHDGAKVARQVHIWLTKKRPKHVRTTSQKIEHYVGWSLNTLLVGPKEASFVKLNDILCNIRGSSPSEKQLIKYLAVLRDPRILSIDYESEPWAPPGTNERVREMIHWAVYSGTHFLRHEG